MFFDTKTNPGGTMEPLVHKNASVTDDELKADAEAYWDASRVLQFLTGFLFHYREEERPWLPLEELHQAFPTLERFKAFAQRPDLRGTITARLTRLDEIVARELDLEKQVELIELAIKLKRVSLHEFDVAFRAKDLVTYMGAEVFWRYFMNVSWPKMVDANSPSEKQFVARMLKGLLTDNRINEDDPLGPIISHLDVRASIDGTTWQRRIPEDARVAVDAARLQQEREDPSKPFTAEKELEIVTLAVIVENLKLSDFDPILRTASKNMGINIEAQEPASNELAEPLPLYDDTALEATATPTAVPETSGSSDEPQTELDDLLEEIPLEEEEKDEGDEAAADGDEGEAKKE